MTSIADGSVKIQATAELNFSVPARARRSRADQQISSEAQHSQEDQRADTLCAEAFWAL
jgi:hypothetical protein